MRDAGLLRPSKAWASDVTRMTFDDDTLSGRLVVGEYVPVRLRIVPATARRWLS